MTEIMTLKAISIAVIFTVTVLAGAFPFIKRLKTAKGHEFPIGEALASGVFLGAGLIHLLGDAASGFSAIGEKYPFAFLLAGAMFLILLWLEHVSTELHEVAGTRPRGFAVLAMIMLSIHSFLAGAALGLGSSLSVTAMLLFAILAHKWAESFALAVQLNKSSLRLDAGMGLFSIFALMVPLGILSGLTVDNSLPYYRVLGPVFMSLAAGTFLYLGTLHGLRRAIMVEKCCNLKQFSFVIIGFSVMALVALWA